MLSNLTGRVAKRFAVHGRRVIRGIGCGLLVASAEGQLLPGIEATVPDAGPLESLPTVEAAGPQVDGGVVLIEELERIVIEGPSGGAPATIGAGIEAGTGLEIPEPDRLVSRLAPMLGRPIRESDLISIADWILIHYDREGFPVVLVEVPDQSLDDGVLRLWVEIGEIGKVGVARPRHGDPEVVRKGLRLRRGDKVRRTTIDAQLAWYGRTIFRRPRLFVSPGDEPASADILIGLEERRPWRLSAGYDNSGPDSLGRERFSLGAAGMLPDEQVLAWQTVLGLPASSLQAHAASWEIPWHRSHQTTRIEAAYAEVATRTPVGGRSLTNEGTSWSVAATQTMMLPTVPGWRQSLAVGLEAKGTDQFLLFGDASFSPGEVRLLHAKLAYEAERRWEDGSVALNLSALGSPGGLIAGNEDADFRAYDAQADSGYLIGRLTASGWWSPGRDWRLALRGAAQISDSRLLPAEQFAVGGHQSVRGVAEREFFADGGWQGSLELFTPVWEPAPAWRMRFLGFFDHAWLGNRGGDSAGVSGAGVGVRMQVTEWVDLRADHGWRLDESGGRTHFGISVAF